MGRKESEGKLGEGIEGNDRGFEGEEGEIRESEEDL